MELVGEPNLLYSCLDFYGNVEQNKQEALEEFVQLPDIEKELEDAEKITQEAEKAVGDAKQNADQADKVATESKLKAENLIKVNN